MALYIVRRVAWAGVVVLIVLMLTFAVFYLMPGRRPGAALRREVADTRVARADPGSTRSRRALVRAVRDLRQERHDGRRVRVARARLLVRRQRLGVERGEGASAPHAAPHRRRRDDLARPRRVDRRALGDTSPVGRGPTLDGLRSDRDLLARLLARPDGAVHLLEQARLDGRNRLRPADREPDRLLLAHDPAVDRARAPVRGHLRPHDAQHAPRHAR